MTPQSAPVISLSERLGPIAWAVRCRLTVPDPGQPPLAEWWRPLVAFARRVRQERVPWPVYPDEFEVSGWVHRGPRPTVTLYRHVDSAISELALGPTGLPHRFIWVDGPTGGRFVECEVRPAIWAASIPGLVEPVWYEHEIDHAADLDDLPDDDGDEDQEPEPPVAPVRHLRLV